MSNPDFLSKIKPPGDAATLLQSLAGLPRPWIFTNGVFDILHPGHARYLTEAKELGGSLIVALNSDESARALGKSTPGDVQRPINRLADRLVMVAALGSVDAVTWFEESTPIILLKSLKPDHFVKGGDYDMDKIPETPVVQSYGGQVHAIGFVQGYSTTQWLNRFLMSSTQ